MNKNTIVYILCVFSFFFVHSQNQKQKSPIDIPMESIFVHKNSEVLFSGERLLFGVHVRDLSTEKASDLSKMAYVQLLGEEVKPIFLKKVELKNGFGHGDFRVGADIETGTYKLMAYTQLARNSDAHKYFETDIFIINPYIQLRERNVVSQTTDSLAKTLDNQIVDMGSSRDEIQNNILSSLVDIELDKEIYGKRETGRLEINSGVSLNGAVLSLSIRKKEAINGPVSISAVDYHSKMIKGTKNRFIDVSEIKWLPELRGDHLTGRLLQVSDSFPVPDTQVVMSIPGSEYIVDIARTDASGRFGFWLEGQYPQTRNGFMQIIGDASDETFIVLDKEGPLLPDNLVFNDFKIDKTLEDIILQRSIQNQLQNAYLAPIPGTMEVTTTDSQPYYRSFDTQYILDEYTRFGSMEETFVEVVEQAWIENVESDDPQFKIRPLPQYPQDIVEEPLVILDGQVVLDHDLIIGIPAREMESIAVSRKKIFMGSKLYQGILHFESKDGKYWERFPMKNTTILEIERSSLLRTYPEFQYDYLSNMSSDLPDFRRQLYWNPKIKVSGDTFGLNIWTSDVTGEYEIRVEGFTEEGKPISGYQKFEVE
ncbi:hypothetical protein GTQ34_01210 [Muricauda sp. JGD-17]|uniref:Macroglobulin domain-containing protein n=1 Tax=Flagellimonas ochracea TaxID=2696472 RepID=A0A964T945_9FLAO|nr:hypothetical protein [Allomuricauda ochracea]NAY90522.1 hypothetical protein [Allomuricauda ochracea]